MQKYKDKTYLRFKDDMGDSKDSVVKVGNAILTKDDVLLNKHNP